MSKLFEELDYCVTPMGALSLRRRTELALGIDIYEVKLGDDYLMSSLFTASEVALARLGLETLDADGLDVAVGGLGLGYTARAALDHPRVRSVMVVDALAEVIDWHRRGLVPLGTGLHADPRCSFVNADFFAVVKSPGFDLDPNATPRLFHAILADIDHSPRALLSDAHGSLYTPAGLENIKRHLHPGGVFALWSNDPPDEDFMRLLGSAFAEARAHVVTFDNPLQKRESSNTVYVARNGSP
jgi:spermidine synthase